MHSLFRVFRVLRTKVSPPGRIFLAMLCAAAAPAGAWPPAVVGVGVVAPSDEVRRVADWIVRSRDNHSLPFIIVDKINARLFLFGAAGGIRAAVPALVGSARGDDSVPGIGSRNLGAIRPAERTTPAGRFVAQFGRDSSGEDVLWVDYATAIALHRASDRKPGPSRQSRLARLGSADADDRRASLGCIGVSTRFYDALVRPMFGAGGIVYVLPETRSAARQFGIPAFASASAIAEGD